MHILCVKELGGATWNLFSFKCAQWLGEKQISFSEVAELKTELIPNCGSKGVPVLFVAYLGVGFSVWVCQIPGLGCAGQSAAGAGGCASLYLHWAPTVAAPLRQLVMLPLEHRLPVTVKLFSDNKALQNSSQNRSKVNGGGLRNVQD